MSPRKGLVLTRNGTGQVFVEYTMILAVLVLVMFGMGPMFQRGLQSLIRLVADQVGVQENAEQKFDESGHIESTYISTRSTTNKRTLDFVGTTNYVLSDAVEMTSDALINLGFTEE
jgi:hypothetical protein